MAFLEENLPSEAEALDRSRSSSQRPGLGPSLAAADVRQRLAGPQGTRLEFGGRNATILQQYVYQMELVAAAGLPELQPPGRRHHRRVADLVRTRRQQQKWAVPILRAEITASLDERSPEPVPTWRRCEPGQCSNPAWTATTSW